MCGIWEVLTVEKVSNKLYRTASVYAERAARQTYA